MKKSIVITTLALSLAACGNNPPVPDWQMNAKNGIDRATAAYMEGNARVEAAEYKRAREALSSTGKIDLIIRAELTQCAARVAALVFGDCAGFDKLTQDASPADRAYAAYLAGRATASDAALLPAQRQRGASHHRSFIEAGRQRRAATRRQSQPTGIGRRCGHRVRPGLAQAAAGLAGRTIHARRTSRRQRRSSTHQTPHQPDYRQMTTATIAITAIPQHTEIARHLRGADFHDCYQTDIAPTSESALALYLKVVAATPRWVNAMMTLRNRIVQLVGLKNLGALGDTDSAKPASAYRVGDRVGIFSIVYLSEQEVILGDSDKHLNVEVSVCKLPDKVAVSTVVHTRNALGRIYMLFVAPAHRRIVPATLRNARFL
jgi:hypothetical protein